METKCVLIVKPTVAELAQVVPLPAAVNFAYVLTKAPFTLAELLTLRTFQRSWHWQVHFGTAKAARSNIEKRPVICLAV